MPRLMLILTLTLIILTDLAIAAQTVTKDNFAEPVIEPKLKEYYLPGEELSVNMTIAPKTTDDGTIIDGRLYEFNTSLENPSMRVIVEYAGSGPVRIYPGKMYIKADVKDWDDGLRKILVEVTGKIPDIDQKIKNIVVIGVDIQDAESDAVSPVVVKVVNKDLFASYISQLEKRLNAISAEIDDLEDEGVAVADIKLKLNSAKTKLEDGKAYLSDEKYGEANTSLSNVEKYLDEAEKLVRKAEVSFKLENAKGRINTMFSKMTELELMIQSLRSKGKSTLSYDIKLEEFKQDYSALNSKISQAEDYLNNGLYDDAENLVNSVTSEANSKIEEIDRIVGEIKPILEETPTPTPTEQKTPEGSEDGEKTSKFFSGIVSWFSENKGRIIFYGGVLVGILIVTFAGYKGIRIYMKKKRWDELK